MPKIQSESWEIMRSRLESRPTIKETREIDWTWERTPWGHKGVCIEDEKQQIVWYTHSNNRHAGGGANTQSYEEFMASGSPHIRRTPENVIEELFDTVRFLLLQASK